MTVHDGDGGFTYFAIEDSGDILAWLTTKGIFRFSDGGNIRLTEDLQSYPSSPVDKRNGCLRDGRLWITERINATGDWRITYYDSNFERVIFTDCPELNGASVEGVEVYGGIVYLLTTLTAGTTGTLLMYDAETGAYLGTDTVQKQGQSSTGLVRVGDFWYVGTQINNEITKSAAVDFTVGGRGFASYAGGASDVRIFKFKSTDLFESQAAVTYTESDSGNIVEGEIIRLALELYYGKSVDVDEYLDYVYGIELTAPTLQSEFPPYQVHKVKGKTFAAAGIADNFRAHTAGEMTIILDDQLPFME